MSLLLLSTVHLGPCNISKANLNPVLFYLGHSWIRKTLTSFNAPTQFKKRHLNPSRIIFHKLIHRLGGLWLIACYYICIRSSRSDGHQTRTYLDRHRLQSTSVVYFALLRLAWVCRRWKRHGILQWDIFKMWLSSREEVSVTWWSVPFRLVVWNCFVALVWNTRLWLTSNDVSSSLKRVRAFNLQKATVGCCINRKGQPTYIAK